MPELPEVEVLVKHLDRVLAGRRVRQVTVWHPKLCRPTPPALLQAQLTGREFQRVTRRGKYLLFDLNAPRKRGPSLCLLGHLGMTGRLFLQPIADPLPRHTAVHLALNSGRLVLLDPRRFGRLTLDLSALTRLGPEPLEPHFTLARFQNALHRSRQAIKVRLLDQSVVAGVGNIYASECLFRARIHPARQSDHLSPAEVAGLRRALRAVLRIAIAQGSTVPLNWSAPGTTDRLFYYGRQPGAEGDYTERLLVYDRENQPCPRCRTPLQRLIQAARSTFFCPNCQPG